MIFVWTILLVLSTKVGQCCHIIAIDSTVTLFDVDRGGGSV